MPLERPVHDLSPREKQLLQLAAEGYTDTAIANKLGISEATVGTYWGRVRIKLGPYSRTELVAIVLRSEQEAAIETLRNENADLIRKLRSEAMEGAAFYRELIENAPDAIILVTETGKIEMANAMARDLFGYEKEEIEGEDHSILVPDRFRGRHHVHHQDYVADPQKREMGAHLDTPALHKDGKEFPVRAALSAIETPAGLVITCVIRPL